MVTIFKGTVSPRFFTLGFLCLIISSRPLANQLKQFHLQAQFC
jgi:hypothetical protein